MNKPLKTLPLPVGGASLAIGLTAVPRLFLGDVRGTVLALSLLAATAQAQAVGLRELLDASTRSHPSVLSARFQSEAAVDGVEVAKRQYWPNVSFQAETNEGPNAGSRLLRLEQPLWNGGLTAASIKNAEIGLDMARTRVASQQQKLFIQVAAAWQSLWSAQGRIKVADASMARLARFERMMKRRVEAELSVPVELELVSARILQVRVDASRAQTDLGTTIERLEQLSRIKGLGAVLGELPVGQSAQTFEPPIARLQSLITQQVDALIAIQPDVRLAREEILSARQQVDIRKAQMLPQAYLRFDQSFSGRRTNGAYIGLNYTSGAGFSALIEAEALSKRALAAEQNAESAEIEARQTLVIEMSELQNARMRLEALNDAVRGAETVLASYERQFVANRKSWQELMNAVRELGQNETARIDAETQLVGALIRLQLRVDPNAIDPSVEAKPKHNQQAAAPEMKTP